MMLYAMLRCARLCYAMHCYAKLRYAMLCCAKLYILGCAILCYAALCYAMLCLAMLCYAMLCCAMLLYAPGLPRLRTRIYLSAFGTRTVARDPGEGLRLNAAIGACAGPASFHARAYMQYSSHSPVVCSPFSRQKIGSRLFSFASFRRRSTLLHGQSARFVVHMPPAQRPSKDCGRLHRLLFSVLGERTNWSDRCATLSRPSVATGQRSLLRRCAQLSAVHSRVVSRV